MIQSKTRISSLNETLTFYDILDILPDASPQDVRDAYIRIKAAYNRDSVVLYTLVSSEEREETLRKIEEAYSILSDPDRRRSYDQNHGLHRSPENPFTGREIPPEPQAEAIPENVFSIGGEKFSLPPTGPAHALPPPIPEKRIVPHKVDHKQDPVILEAIQNETEWSGSFLRRVREGCRISIEEMSGITKVTKHYLIAIEDENFEKLPAVVYIRGFVAQIAKVLKLPHEKVANAYLTRYRRARMEPVK